MQGGLLARSRGLWHHYYEHIHHVPTEKVDDLFVTDSNMKRRLWKTIHNKLIYYLQQISKAGRENIARYILAISTRISGLKYISVKDAWPCSVRTMMWKQKSAHATIASNEMMKTVVSDLKTTQVCFTVNNLLLHETTEMMLGIHALVICRTTEP